MKATDFTQSPFATIIQCRAGSHRLPNKALRKIAGRPMLAHVIERAQAYSVRGPVIVATSVNSKDDGIAKLCKKEGVGCFRGDEADVLGRMSAAAKAASAVIITRITGDCPLFAPDVAQLVFEEYAKSGCGIATNDTRTSGWPDGMDVEVFQADTLHEAAKHATDQHDREHVTPWIRRTFSNAIIPGPLVAAPKVKLSVDTEADYKRVKAIMEQIPKGEFGWEATFAAARTFEAGRRGESAAPDLPPPAVAALRKRKLSIQDAAAMSDEDLLAIDGIGAATVQRIREVVA